MLGWRLLRGDPAPGVREWSWAVALGALYFLVGNGAVVWSEQRLASGTVALMVAMVPLWVLVLPWLARRSRRPRASEWLGLALGLTGMFVLVGPGAGAVGSRQGAEVAAMTIGPLGWAIGTLLARRAPQPASAFAAGGMQMIAGGALMLAVGLALGESGRLAHVMPSPLAIGSVVYLVLAGSVVAFSAYAWLVRNVPAPAVSTYALVNPLIAVLLGSLFAREPLTPRVLIAAALIVSAVALITRAPSRPDSA
jgi:drug/metabolite transporter (DMT)-like permease